jgi:ribose transport system substrate-binding protein
MRRLSYSLLLLSAIALGCTSSSDTGASGHSRSSHRTIGVSVLTLTNPFFKTIGDSLTDELGKQGYEVSLVSGDFNVAKQRDQVKDFIVRKVSAIVLCPCDSKAIGPVIKEANAAGVPVFTADIACLDPEAKVIAHIATDNHQGGKEAGKAMIEALGNRGGKIAILDFKVVESCILRVKGFKEVIDEHNAKSPTSKVEIVAELNGGGAKDVGYKAAEDLLQAHPNLTGIFAINDLSALGAHAALEKAGKAKQIKLIAFDGQPEGKQAIKDGKIYADPIQFPERIGRTTAQTILKHFEGEPVEKEILIPSALYRKADADKDPELK